MTDASGHPVVDADVEAQTDKKTRVVTVRCSSAQRQQMKELAAGHGFSIGAYIRSTLLGSAGPRSRRRPTLDHETFGRLLGDIGHVGGNLNQIARALHIHGDRPAQLELARAAGDIAAIRAALMQALGRRPVASQGSGRGLGEAQTFGHQG